MSERGTRGKWAETKFRKWCVKKSESTFDFSFYRFPDARAGSKSSVPSDFEVLYKGKHFNVEVKEVDHDFRLPHKNFSPDKVARMRKFEMAGSACWVFIYFKPAGVWRIETIAHFLEKQGGSWDMSNHAAVDFDTALREIFGD